MDADTFVQNVKIFSKEMGISATAACKASGVGSSFLTDIKRGQTPSVAKVQALAKFLGKTTSQLLGEDTGLSPDEMALLMKYRALTDSEKKAGISYIQFIADSEKKEKAN